MKEFVISEAKVETAVLVGLITQTQDERKTTEYLDELEFLAHTAGATVVRRFTQKLPCAHSVTYVGKGKLEEIRDYIRAEEEEEREIERIRKNTQAHNERAERIRRELAMNNEDDYDDIIDEMCDRYGEPNSQAVNLCRIARIRAMGRLAGFTKIEEKIYNRRTNRTLEAVGE